VVSLNTYIRSESVSNHKMRLLVALVGIFSIFNLGAQTDRPYQELDYNNPQEYQIAEVKVVGTESRDKNAIKSITGLREGESVRIPSNELTDGIKKLWSLGIFADVTLVLDKIESDSVYLTIELLEQPILSRIVFDGVNKTKQDKLKEELGETLRVGGIPTVNSKEVAKQKIIQYYQEKGFLDAVVEIEEVLDSTKTNSVVLVFKMDQKERVKIDEIAFSGNENVKDKKLRKLLKGTKKKGTLLKKSKFLKEDYEEDKKNLIRHYATLGYSDAQIVADSFYRNEDGNVVLGIDISEGTQYKYGNITWKGNSIYTTDQLASVLGISKGQVFNPEELNERLEFSLDGRDVSSLYMDNGHLFFNIDPKQIAVRNDSIDIEMRIYEGPQATIDRVTIKGNTRTHDHVVRRILRTKPGEKFSRSQIVRSQREITSLGYFNPETLQMNTPVNYERGTVDIEYILEERPSDQLELSAGYGGFQGLIGTLGVTFNNFSLQNINKKGSWSPLPTGDGQRLSVRLQSNGRFFRSFNFSFTEPWLGGKKPNALTVGAQTSSFDNTTVGSGKLQIRNFFAGLGTRLRWPDDFFTSTTTVNLETISLEDFSGQFIVNDGNFRNFNISQVFSRSSIANPMFPTSGSRVALTIQFTPPYSLFRKDRFFEFTDAEIDDLHRERLLELGIRQREEYFTTIGADGLTAADRDVQNAEESRRFEFLEYHKWRLDAEWYFNPIGKLVFTTSAKMGFLGNYNSEIGDVPFERFELGGDGLSNQGAGITGLDIIALRGYEVVDIDPNSRLNGGGIIFNKFTAELRYPLSTNPNSTIYSTLFFQGGNQWSSFDEYNPFDLRRSVGVGLRVFLPAFGLLGFDYGFGLDKEVAGAENPTLGQLGKFSIILGFEPD